MCRARANWHLDEKRTGFKVAKRLVLLITVLSANVHAAGAVEHQHAGRLHAHLLPGVGVKHQHRGGAVGQLPAVQVAGKQPVTLARAGGRVTAYCTSLTDCNPCANNVRAQFADAGQGRVRWQNIPWHFAWPDTYPPQYRSANSLFNGVPIALGIPNEHVQGFVRTYSRQYPFAGSHSHKKQGGVFLIGEGQAGRKQLAAILPSRSRHPSGVHMLGQYLVYGEGRELVFVDLQAAGKETRLNVPVINGQKPNYGGGVGLVKVTENEWLVVLSGPGGQDSRPRFHRFYRLTMSEQKPQRLEFLSQSPHTLPAGWGRIYGFSENVSLIAECGTGDVYAVHTTGDDGIKVVAGNGYWRLSQLEGRGKQLRFKPITGFSTPQNMSSCSMRASATVHVTPAGKLEFYCHAWAKDPDGSFLNILGKSSRNQDRFYFRRGILD